MLAACFTLVFWVPYSSTRVGDVPPKRQLTFNGPHGVIYQKVELIKEL
jgi:hypothetical protein